MNQTIFFCSLALMSAFLFGCQAENEEVEAEETRNVSEAQEIDSLLMEGEIARVEISKTKGVNPTIYDETESIAFLKEAFSNAIRQPGIVNISAPEFYVKVILKEGQEQYFNLWLGDEKGIAILMDVSDTHTIYAITTEMTAKLIDLMKE